MKIINCVVSGLYFERYLNCREVIEEAQRFKSPSTDSSLPVMVDAASMVSLVPCKSSSPTAMEFISTSFTHTHSIL